MKQTRNVTDAQIVNSIEVIPSMDVLCAFAPAYSNKSSTTITLYVYTYELFEYVV